MQEINDRKKDHIELSLKSSTQMYSQNLGHDQRFFYEPLLGRHPQLKDHLNCEFLGKNLKAPLWISSMTGGTESAGLINQRLAKAANIFGLGMGLGSCRMILQDLKKSPYWGDFNVRPILGNQCLLFANLGIAQLEELLLSQNEKLIENLIDALEADGIIIHINPLQEWMQTEGDRFKQTPLETLKCFFETPLYQRSKFKVIVKEVGQGMGPMSLKALMDLPVSAIELAGWGGTNFVQVEYLRNSHDKIDINKNEEISPLSTIGHNCEEMVTWINEILREKKSSPKCENIIISGGIKNYLDGHFLLNKLACNGLIGQGQSLLRRALISEEKLHSYISEQISGLMLSREFLVQKDSV